MPFARASELDRLLACPGSLLLPRSDVKSEAGRRGADWGSLCHGWKESGEIPDTKDGASLRKKLKESGVDRAALWQHGLHEVPLAYNPRSNEVRALVIPLPLEEKNAWKAEFGLEWITGTADYVGRLMDRPWVDDLKTGRRVEYLDHQYQQAFYCLAWTLFGGNGLEDCRSTITHWPRYPLGIKPNRFGVHLDANFFTEFRAKLIGLMDLTQRLRGRRDSGMDVTSALTDGEHCTYCPSRPNCTKGLKYE